jgi:hypothetical protein
MRLFRSILTLALVGGGVFATAGVSQAGFSVTVSGGAVGTGSTSVSNGNVAYNITYGSPTDVFVVDVTAGSSVGNVLDLNNVLLTNTGSGPLSVTVVIRSDDISYLEGIGTLRATPPGIVSSSGVAVNSQSVSTGNVGGATLATIAGASGVVTFPTGPSVPRFISRTYDLTFDAGATLVLLDLGGGTNVADVNVTTPAPMTLVAALGCLPVLGFVGFLRRRNVKPVETA